MFRCKSCGSTDFQLVIHPDFNGRVEINRNEHDEVIVTAGEQEFVADLMFINQFGICSSCKATKKWEYYFPNKHANAVD